MSNFRQIKDSLPYSEKAERQYSGFTASGYASTDAAPEYKGHTINGFTPTHKTGGPAWNEGLKNATPVQHTNNKGDGKDIGRGKVITY